MSSDSGRNKNGRTNLMIPTSNLEKVLNIISIVVILTIWLYLLVSWNHIPDRIPTHFGPTGKPDSWGGKEAIFISPIIASILYIIISTVSKFPQHYNYIIKITEENAERQYRNARMMMSWLLPEITLLFLYIEYKSIDVAIGNSNGLNAWFTPVFLVVLFGTLGIHMNRMIRFK